MPSKICECPFCGQIAKSTDEHVWAQWLHNTRAAKLLLDGSHGARLPQQTVTYHEDAEGRLRAQQSQTGFVAELLPNVKLPVCRECNSGWMSRLEESAKKSLGPYMFGEKSSVTLTQQDIGKLASWATKSIMAYYCTNSDLQNPFRPNDYRTIATTSEPPDHCTLWMLSSHHPNAQVSLGVFSMYFSFEGDSTTGPDPDAPDNFGLAFLAVQCCVFVLVRWPERMPQKARDALVPPQMNMKGVRQIWPNPRPQYFPLEELPDTDFTAFMKFPEQITRSLALPALGLTSTERAEAMQQFMAGESPADIRAAREP